MLSKEKQLRRVSVILAAASILLLSVSLVFLMDEPDPASRVGRHLIAGSLANAALAVTFFLIALFPLRRGEQWTFWAFVLLCFLYGIPIFIIDSMFVPRANLLATLLPQGIGLLMVIVGLMFAFRGIFGKKP